MKTSSFKNTLPEHAPSRFEIDAEHPKIHGPTNARRGRRCWLLLAAFTALCASAIVRGVYVTTFLVDDIYEVNEIRGYYTSEKYTIRTIAPVDIADLKAFVEHYTICPLVHEIRVAWWHEAPPPADEVFTYTKAHSTVTFDRVQGTFGCDQKEFATPSIILLDADVFVECADIKYLGEVFQSSSNALVGFYPRLHKKVGEFQFDFLSWGYVVWNRAYSLMLASGLMIDTTVYNSICDSSEVSKQVTDVLKKAPQCHDVFFSVWNAHKDGKPPVWVPISPSIRQIGSVATPWSAVSSAERGRCISTFARITGVKDFYSAAHKAADARNELFW